MEGELLIEFYGGKILKRKADVVLKFILHKNCKRCFVVATFFDKGKILEKNQVGLTTKY